MDIIILALITAFIFYRLNKNLGNIDEEEKQEIHKKLMERKKQIEEILKRASENANNLNQDNSIANNQEKIIGSGSTDKNLANLDDKSQENLQKIYSLCNISHEFFINGAKMAFEMVINAFSKEDYNTLKILLAENLYDGFKKSIDDRKANNHKLTTNLISVNDCEIKSALLIDNIASIILKINSKQINYILDQNQTLIHGSKEEIHDVNDIWTFKKNIKDTNPNWIISATSSN